jgi:hypothetical protein
MAIATYQAQVSIPYFTLIPTDVVTNVWHFRWFNVVTDPTTTDYNNLRDGIKLVYNTIYGSVGTEMSPWMRPALTKMKFYNLADAVPRPPRYDQTVPLTVNQGAGSLNIPEMAICASYQAVPLAGESQARRRGRIYFGGCANALIGGNNVAFPVVTAAFRTIIANAMKSLPTTLATTDWQWVVYSKAANNVSVAQNGWVDDAVDIQRRRGQAPLVRTTWTFP